MTDPLYRIAQEITDEVMGEGAYAELNRNNPDPKIQALLAESPRGTMKKTVRMIVTDTNATNVFLNFEIDDDEYEIASQDKEGDADADIFDGFTGIEANMFFNALLERTKVKAHPFLPGDELVVTIETIPKGSA